ncbi:helix-turn-helix transcriptional regulator, partial [Escherichia coli]|uniref:helix-turn-helix transcriptional regulator n=2 Tax=Escherichia coli TaxID=562 RepID=UPI0021691A50
LSAEFTIGEGELMAHDVPLGCAPDEYDDLISGTCSHLPYVIQRRMTEAKWSLTNTELSQAEISWRVGYENVDHFAKLFLRHVGCSPSDYRRQFKNCFAEQEILSEFPQPVSLVG